MLFSLYLEYLFLEKLQGFKFSSPILSLAKLPKFLRQKSKVNLYSRPQLHFQRLQLNIRFVNHRSIYFSLGNLSNLVQILSQRSLVLLKLLRNNGLIDINK